MTDIGRFIEVFGEGKEPSPDVLLAIEDDLRAQMRDNPAAPVTACMVGVVQSLRFVHAAYERGDVEGIERNRREMQQWFQRVLEHLEKGEGNLT
jgi:hypothetical protein